MKDDQVDTQQGKGNREGDTQGEKDRQAEAPILSWP